MHVLVVLFCRCESDVDVDVQGHGCVAKTADCTCTPPADTIPWSKYTGLKFQGGKCVSVSDEHVWHLFGAIFVIKALLLCQEITVETLKATCDTHWSLSTSYVTSQMLYSGNISKEKHCVCVLFVMRSTNRQVHGHCTRTETEPPLYPSISMHC